MPLLKAKEIRSMSKDERSKTLRDLQQELMHERGAAAMGGAPISPGKMRALRTSIARILTVNKEEKLQ